MTRGIVIHKSGEKQGKRGPYKFVTIQDEDDPSRGYTFLLFPTSFGDYPRLFTYDIIEFSGTLEPKPVTKYDTSLAGACFKTLSFVTSMYWNVAGRYSKAWAVTVPLATVKFYHDYLQDETYNVIVHAKDLGFDYFPSSMGSLQLEGYIKVAGTFSVSLRPVARPDGTKEWKDTYKFIDGTIDASLSDLSALVPHVKEAKVSAERERAIEALLGEIKRDGIYLDIYNARNVLRARGIDDGMFNDAQLEEALNNVTMKPSYNPAFFHELKRAQEKGVGIYYGQDGFVFRINGRWAWEKPEPASATYMFDGRVSIEELRCTLSKVHRVDILENRTLQDAMLFLGRAIHPPDGENGEGMARWLRDVMEGRGVRHEEMEGESEQ